MLCPSQSLFNLLIPWQHGWATTMVGGQHIPPPLAIPINYFTLRLYCPRVGRDRKLLSKEIP